MEDPWLFEKQNGSISSSMALVDKWFPSEELSNGAHLNSEQSLIVSDHLHREINSKGYFK